MMLSKSLIGKQKYCIHKCFISFIKNKSKDPYYIKRYYNIVARETWQIQTVNFKIKYVNTSKYFLFCFKHQKDKSDNVIERKLEIFIKN